MKVIVATSIYPPEIGRPATYVVELVKRLRDEHDVVIVAYTDSQEAPEGVKLIGISKTYPLWFRLIKYAITLWHVTHAADLVLVQNAMSAGLPTAVICLIRNKPFMVKFLGDEAEQRMKQRHVTKKNITIRLMALIERWVLTRAYTILASSSLQRDKIISTYGIGPEKIVMHPYPAETPEILPFPIVRKPHQITAIDLSYNAVPAIEIVKKSFADVTYEDRKNISRAETWYMLQSSTLCLIDSTDGKAYSMIERCYTAQTPFIDVHDLSAVELADAIMSILTDVKRSQDMVNAGQKILSESLSWESHLKELEALFQKITLHPVHVSPHALL